MKFSFLLLLTSNAILATSAAYTYTKISGGQGLHELFENRSFDPTTDTLKLGETKFPEAVSVLEGRVEAAHVLEKILKPADTHCLERFKVKIYKDLLVEAAKWTDDRSFLVALNLYDIYRSEVRIANRMANENSDRDTLALRLKDKEEILLTAAAQGSLLKVEMLLWTGDWVASDFPKLMDKAAAEGLSWVVDILLQDDRAEEGITSLTRNINIDTTLSDLVGPHLLEYIKWKFGTSADNQLTANEMWWDAMGLPARPELARGPRNYLRFLALLDKADASWHENALAWCQERYPGDYLFEEAILLAYGKFDILPPNAIYSTEDDYQQGVLFFGR